MSINNHLANLKQKHANLDKTLKNAISQLRNDNDITNIKKQKLLIKEKIERLQTV